MDNFFNKYERETSLINKFLTKPIEASIGNQGIDGLMDSIRYSVNSGGKRFRPLLCLLTAKTLRVNQEWVLAFAAAVEFVHTYSLIHDDLPSMDNDDERRGVPTNHKVYGEATALLAGDALQTLAFELISSAYIEKPNLGLKVVGILSRAAGAQGMVGGQAIDILALSGRKMLKEELLLMHNLKTGALIHSAIMGAAVLCDATEEQLRALDLYGRQLGIAFQLADDILDHDPNRPENSGFPKVIGIEETREMLEDVTQDALIALRIFGDRAQNLIEIAQFNLNRAL